MVALILFVLVTFAVGCFVVGSVVVEARREGRAMIPAEQRARFDLARSAGETAGA